jgi:hypothetical protein
MEAVALAVLVSVGAITVALLIDGADFRGYDFTVNVLASLALLGPGLIITNVLARNWRRRRRYLGWSKSTNDPVERACRSLEADLFEPTVQFLKGLAAELKLDIDSASTSGTTLVPGAPETAIYWAAFRSFNLNELGRSFRRPMRARQGNFYHRDALYEHRFATTLMVLERLLAELSSSGMLVERARYELAELQRDFQSRELLTGDPYSVEEPSIRVRVLEYDLGKHGYIVQGWVLDLHIRFLTSVAAIMFDLAEDNQEIWVVN